MQTTVEVALSDPVFTEKPPIIHQALAKKKGVITEGEPGPSTSIQHTHQNPPRVPVVEVPMVEEPEERGANTTGM